MPFICVAWFLNYLDRLSISFADLPQAWPGHERRNLWRTLLDQHRDREPGHRPDAIGALVLARGVDRGTRECFKWKAANRRLGLYPARLSTHRSLDIYVCALALALTSARCEQ